MIKPRHGKGRSTLLHYLPDIYVNPHHFEGLQPCIWFSVPHTSMSPMEALITCFRMLQIILVITWTTIIIVSHHTSKPLPHYPSVMTVYHTMQNALWLHQLLIGYWLIGLATVILLSYSDPPYTTHTRGWLFIHQLCTWHLMVGFNPPHCAKYTGCKLVIGLSASSLSLLGHVQLKTQVEIHCLLVVGSLALWQCDYTAVSTHHGIFHVHLYAVSSTHTAWQFQRKSSKPAGWMVIMNQTLPSLGILWTWYQNCCTLMEKSGIRCRWCWGLVLYQSCPYVDPCPVCHIVDWLTLMPKTLMHAGITFGNLQQHILINDLPAWCCWDPLYFDRFGMTFNELHGWWCVHRNIKCQGRDHFQSAVLSAAYMMPWLKDCFLPTIPCAANSKIATNAPAMGNTATLCPPA